MFVVTRFIKECPKKRIHTLKSDKTHYTGHQEYYYMGHVICKTAFHYGNQVTSQCILGSSHLFCVTLRVHLHDLVRTCHRRIRKPKYISEVQAIVRRDTYIGNTVVTPPVTVSDRIQ